MCTMYKEKVDVFVKLVLFTVFNRNTVQKRKKMIFLKM